MTEARVIVKCEGCAAKRTIHEGEIPAFDFPICDHCGMPMLPVKVESTRPTGTAR